MVLNKKMSEASEDALLELVEKECQVDGVTGNEAWASLAYTYKAINLLAIGDSISEKVGDVSREARSRVELAQQYENLYKNLLSKNGITVAEKDATS